MKQKYKQWWKEITTISTK